MPNQSITSTEVHLWIHGWTDSINATYSPKLFQAYRDFMPDVIFCLVDWHRIAYFEYQIVVPYAYKVGKLIANTINAWNIDPTKVTLVGHSLGSHIAGEAGRILKIKGKKLGRIYGKKYDDRAVYYLLHT